MLDKRDIVGLTSLVAFAQLDSVIDRITCEVCHELDLKENMILCDSYNQGYHADYIGLKDVPEFDWYCK